MSRYFSLFNTEAQYQAAKETLDYPNVSLINVTGDLHYTKYTGKEVANAPFGSILMAEIATNNLFYIDNSEYNLIDYPFEDFNPIGVCIFDKASNANDQTVFLAVQWADYEYLGIPKASIKKMSWGFNNVNLSQTVTGIRDSGTNHVSSISINNAVKPLITKDYSGSSITDTSDDGESTAFCSCWRFKTAGTIEGDWYLPSYYDFTKYRQNSSSINKVLTNIKTIAGSSYLNNVNYEMFSAYEYSNTYAYYLQTNNNYAYASKSNKTTAAVRPVFVVNIEEV